MSERIKCERCGTMLPAGSIFCTECGGRDLKKIVRQPERQNVEEPRREREPMQSRFCENCGQRVEVDSSFCIYCGMPFAETDILNDQNIVQERSYQEQNVYQESYDDNNEWNGEITQKTTRKKKSSNLWIFILIGILVLVLVGGGSAFLLVTAMNGTGFFSSSQEEDEDEDDEKESKWNEEENEEMTEETTAEAETEEFVAGSIALDYTVEQELQELLYYYINATSNGTGELIAVDKTICNTFLAYTLGWCGTDEVELYYSPEVLMETNAGHRLFILSEDAAEAYLEASINKSNTSSMTYDTQSTAVTDVVNVLEASGELTVDVEDDLVYTICGEWGDYMISEILFTEVEAISPTEIVVTGTAVDQWYGGDIYGHSYTLLFEENPDSIWGGYTLMEVQSWEISTISVAETTTELTGAELTGTALTDAYLTESMLKDLSAEELRIMRNEIYARHGYTFQDEELAAYFGSQSWYTATTDAVSESAFNQYEKANIDLIKEMEEAFN